MIIKQQMVAQKAKENNAHKRGQQELFEMGSAAGHDVGIIKKDSSSLIHEEESIT